MHASYKNWGNVSLSSRFLSDQFALLRVLKSEIINMMQGVVWAPHLCSLTDLSFTKMGDVIFCKCPQGVCTGAIPTG